MLGLGHVAFSLLLILVLKTFFSTATDLRIVAHSTTAHRKGDGWRWDSTEVGEGWFVVFIGI